MTSSGFDGLPRACLQHLAGLQLAHLSLLRTSRRIIQPGSQSDDGTDTGHAGLLRPSAVLRVHAGSHYSIRLVPVPGPAPVPTARRCRRSRRAVLLTHAHESCPVGK